MEYIINERIKFVYSQADVNYINDVISYFKENYASIMRFFNINELDKPLVITFWDNINIFRNEIKKISNSYDLPFWVVGSALNEKNSIFSRIDYLSLKECKKIKGLDNEDINELKKTIIHEFVHICHSQFCNYNKSIPLWIKEGIAVYLSNQNENVEIEKISEFKNDQYSDYNEYRFIFNKLFAMYPIENILEILSGKDCDKVLEEIINKCQLKLR